MSGTLRTNLVGLKFGRLTVLALDPNLGTGGRRYWHCICECGIKTRPATDKLKSGRTLSCGCYTADSLRNIAYRHGMSHSSGEYKSWSGLRDRCTNSNSGNFKNYGGRGISFCPSWGSFETFLKDMGMRPGPEYSIERLNNNGNYSKDNCVWATRRQQSRNRRNVTLHDIGGISKVLTDWCDDLGLPYGRVRQRVASGRWTLREALELDPRKTNHAD